MKYNPDAYLDYPVLRPNSSDYPDGRLATRLTRTPADGNLDINLRFEIDEPAIHKQIEKGDALCCAFLYSRSACYSEMLRADKRSIVIAASVPLRYLAGRVELHPSVIAIDDLAINPKTVHPEYGQSTISVNKHRQLAMDEPWYFAVGYVGTIESVFHLEQDDNASLKDWEFDFQAEPNERYIVIRSNPQTYSEFQNVRQRVSLTTATVYLNALTTALAALESSEEEELSEGWAATVRAHLEKQSIQWPNSCSHGLAAQRLLQNPLTYLPEAPY